MTKIRTVYELNHSAFKEPIIITLEREVDEMQAYYVYPDGTITQEPLDFMSDDYYILHAWDYEEAYEQAYLLGLI